MVSVEHVSHVGDPGVIVIYFMPLYLYTQADGEKMSKRLCNIVPNVRGILSQIIRTIQCLTVLMNLSNVLSQNVTQIKYKWI